MTFTHALATNNYGPAKFIVDSSAANGTHTTIAAALTSASSGDTIFVRQGTYTENLTLKAGVNLVSFEPTVIFGTSGTSPSNVIILGKCSFSSAGSVGITGITLKTNSDFCLSVTGSAASLVTLTHCYLQCSNNTAIQFSSSSASSGINLNYCGGSLDTTGIGIFAHSGAGILWFTHTQFNNPGTSLTANTISSTGTFHADFCDIFNPLTASSSSGSTFLHSNITGVGNQTAITTSNTASIQIIHGFVSSGTASAISVGSGTTVELHYCFLNSSNATTISGTGTLEFSSLTSNSVLSLAAGLTLSLGAMQSFNSAGGVGTSGQVWTSNGVSTPPSFQAGSAGSGNLVKISSQTASNSASIVFTSGISATYTDYVLVCKNVVPVSNATSIRLRISTDGGSNYVATGYNSSAASLAQTSTTEFMLGNGAFFSNSGSPMSGYHYLFNMTTGTGNPQHVGTVNWPQSNISGAASNFAVGGWAPASSTVNALQITMSSGNISAGTFILYGITP